MASTVAPPPSYDSPPSYEDYKKDVDRLIEKAKSDPVFKQKVKESFLKGAGSDETLKKIREGVDQFTANISKINTTFDDIRSKLYSIDLKELKDSKGVVWKGEAKWVDLRGQWKDLLKASQATALKSVARCDEFQMFCQGALKIKSLDEPRYKDTITELENFIKVADPSGKHYNPEQAAKDAQAHSEAFSRLKDRLSDFKTLFDDFAKFQKTQIDKDITTLNEQISKLETEITFDATMIASLGVALGVTVFSTLAGGVIAGAMGPLSPIAIIALVIGSLLAIGEAGTLAYFIADWIDKTGQRDRLKDQVKDKEALKQALEDVMSKLANTKDGLGFIMAQVDLLKNVWHTISNEANLIVDMLKGVKDKKTLTYFQDELTEAQSAYSELSKSLAKYSRAG